MKIAHPEQAIRRHFVPILLGAVIAISALCTSSGAAFADFRLCNNTPSRVGIALGYKDSEGWVTEGWWNINARACETLLKGTLVARYYYIYGLDYDRGGEWSGKAFMCSKDKEFTIKGTNDCLARGFDRTGYFEVDTGEQSSWTVQLSESAETSVPRAPNLPGLPNAQGSQTGTTLPPASLPPASSPAPQQ
ncbi:MAG: DUF1036 domain-containing protein [Xanthobacteraceae bacterium]|nr:DUF1036 domain-containing protein [Xanthobacteraceae bacterium]